MKRKNDYTSYWGDWPKILPALEKLKKHFLVKSFYSFNYVNVNYSIKYSTVDYKYLLFLQGLFLCSVKNANCLKNNI